MVASAAFPADAAIIDFQDRALGAYVERRRCTLDAGGVDVTLAGTGLRMRDVARVRRSQRGLAVSSSTTGDVAAHDGHLWGRALRPTSSGCRKSDQLGVCASEVDFGSMSAFDELERPTS